MQVFISHSSSDVEVAKKLASQLSSAGIPVWNPETNIHPGDNWAKEISNALEESEVMVVLFSKGARGASNIEREVQYALTSGKYHGRIIPVLIGYATFEAGKDVPWVLLRMDPYYVNVGLNDFTAIVERVQSLVRAKCNAE